MVRGTACFILSTNLLSTSVFLDWRVHAVVATLFWSTAVSAPDKCTDDPPRDPRHSVWTVTGRLVGHRAVTVSLRGAVRVRTLSTRIVSLRLTQEEGHSPASSN
jgi:hypothetical protein